VDGGAGRATVNKPRSRDGVAVFNFAILGRYVPDFLSGLAVTAELTAVSLSIGLVLGLALALARGSGVRVLSWPAYAYIEFFRTTPPLVQIVWFYFGMPLVVGRDVSSFQAAAIALGLNIAAFLAEVFRAGIQGIPVTQWHAAKVLGLSRVHTLRFVILPQAARIVIAPIGTTVILLIKGTALATAIGTPELLRIGQLVAVETFRPLEALTLVAVVYFVATYPVAIAFGLIEKRLRAGED
jgi:polar amino acid transport system permease protein